MAEAVDKSGSWIACKPGCASCCYGPFPITMLDAERLREGLGELERQDPARAARVRRRSARYIANLPGLPGDPAGGAVLEEWFDAYEDEQPCPALDPATGTCDLYVSRPITCRVFGPAVRGEGGAVGTCELCYEGAREEEIAACQVQPDPDGLERDLLGGDVRQTLVALALR